jgi:sodium-dependent dicarboxylate transporter 2/3/5
MGQIPHASEPWTTTRVVGLFLGPLLAFILYHALPDAIRNDAGEVLAPLSPAGRMTIAIGAWLATWWVTEAIAIEAAALLPLVAFPLAGVADFRSTAALYADEVVYLFLGGMLLGSAMERWNLHKRLALLVMVALGASPHRLIAGLLLATALLSMWVSNTAACIMMLPIAIGVVRLARDRHESAGGGPRDASAPEPASDPPSRNFGIAAMLAIAYGASIGGVATLVGTPPNGVAAAFVARTYEDTLTFAEWLKIGVPTMLITLPLCWGLLVLVFPMRGLRIEGADAMLRHDLAQLGSVTRGEWLVITVFTLASVFWIFRPQLAGLLGLTRVDDNGRTIVLLSDAGIAITASLLMFLMPVHPKHATMLLDWKTARTIPWGVLLLFGGGLTLAAAVERHNVDDVLAALLDGLRNVHPLVVVLVVVAGAMFVSEIGSNTAVATVLLPVVATAAPVLDVHPYVLIFGVTLAVSLAFMMPSGTPPNALVFSSGYLRVPQMVRAGLLLNLVCVVIITVVVYGLAGVMGALP